MKLRPAETRPRVNPFSSGSPAQNISWMAGGAFKSLWAALPGRIQRLACLLVLSAFLLCSLRCLGQNVQRARSASTPVATSEARKVRPTCGDYRSLRSLVRTDAAQFFRYGVGMGPFSKDQAVALELGSLGWAIVIQGSHCGGSGGNCSVLGYVRAKHRWRNILATGGNGVAQLPSGRVVPDLVFSWTIDPEEIDFTRYRYKGGRFVVIACESDITPDPNFPSHVKAGVKPTPCVGLGWLDKITFPPPARLMDLSGGVTPDGCSDLIPSLSPFSASAR